MGSVEVKLRENSLQELQEHIVHLHQTYTYSSEGFLADLPELMTNPQDAGIEDLFHSADDFKDPWYASQFVNVSKNEKQNKTSWS